jgi:hypothetical protein
MTPAKEFDGELWIKAGDHHQAVGSAFEAGKHAAFASAAYSIGIDTGRGDIGAVTVFRMLPGQPTVLVANAYLPSGTTPEVREQCAQIVEAMGMQGYGTLAIAAAIRKGQA